MEFVFQPFNERHYAIKLQQTETKTLLKWMGDDESLFLMVRSEFGVMFSFTNDIKEEMCRRVTRSDIAEGKEIRIREGLYMHFFRVGLAKNVPITARPARYSIFAFEFLNDGNTCLIYESNIENKSQCDIPSSVSVTIRQKQIRRKLFNRGPEKIVYDIVIPSIPGYIDGSLYYSFEGLDCRYPITEGLLGMSGFSVESFNGIKPIVRPVMENGFIVDICE